MNRSLAQGVSSDPWADRWPDPRIAGWWSVAAGLGLALAALAIYSDDAGRSLLRPLRVAGRRVPRGPGRDPLPGRGRRGRLGQRVLPGRPADRHERRRARGASCRSRHCPALVLVPFVALVGPARPTTRRSSRSSPRSTWRSAGGCSAGSRAALRVRAGTHGLLRLRHGVLVHGPGHHDLVPGPHRGRGSDAPGDRARPGARPDAPTDGRGIDDAPAAGPRRAARRRTPPDVRDLLAVDGRQFVAGFLFGLACTARLTVVFGAPFLALVGSGGDWWRRSWSAGLGAAVPILALVALQRRHDGHVFHPAYDYLYPLEANGYPTLGYHPEWSVEDPAVHPPEPRHRPVRPAGRPADRAPEQHRLRAGARVPRAGRHAGLFDLACPLAVPRDIGMSVLLTSPAYLLAIPALRGFGRSRLVTGAVARDRGHLGRQPDALQPGLGPVRLPVQQRLRAVRVAPRGARAERLARRHAWGLPLAAGAARRVDGDQPVGRPVEPAARVVSRVAARSTGGSTAARVRRRSRWPPASPSSRRWSAMLPGLGVLGHRRAADGRPADGHGSPGRLPDLRAPRLAGLGRPPAVRRAGVPDEPALRRCASRSRPAVTVDLVRALTRLDASWASRPASAWR